MLIMGYDYFQEFLKIKEMDNGSRFWKVDLHLHSPASHFDFKNKDINEYEYVKKLIDFGYDMVAITDHATGEWIDKLKTAAKAFKNRGKGKIVILPGVEVTVNGIHLLIIFPEDKCTKDIDHFLSKIDIPPDVRGRDISHTTKSLVDVIDIAHELDGSVIGAHAHSNSGAVNGLSGQPRLDVLSRIDALEIKVDQENPDKTIKYVREDLGFSSMPFVRGSDAHDIDNLAVVPMWLRMGFCGFDALTQIKMEPYLRIKFHEPDDLLYPAILGLSTSGGIFKGTTFVFNENFNIIIGPRASGKSALIDLIRWSLDIKSLDPDGEKNLAHRIVCFLEGGHTVRLYVRGKDKRYYIIERTLDYNKDSHGKISFIQKPRILEIIEDCNEIIESNKCLSDVFELEVFGQGEVLELTKRAENQLKLIDEYIGASNLKSEEQSLLKELCDNSTCIVELKEKIEQLNQELENREPLEKRKKYLEEHLEHEIFKTHEFWQREKTFLEDVKNILNQWEEVVNSQDYYLPELNDWDIKNTPNPPTIDKAKNILNTTKDQLINYKIKQKEILDNSLIELQKLIVPWEQKFKIADDNYHNKLQELGFTNYKSLANELTKIKTKISTLNSKTLPLRNKYLEEYKCLQKERAELLEKLKHIRKQLSNKRKELAERLTNELENIKIEISEAANKETYFSFLEQLYAGSGISNRIEQLQKISNTISPQELAKLIIDRNIEEIIKLTSVTEKTAEKIVNYPSFERILELETIALDDNPRIMLKKVDEYDYTELESLSYGEKCSAILSIALLNKGKPLIIDQPEDEVDYNFVSNDIVGSICKMKDTRQLFFSTYNANIPVLGDADLVFKLTKCPGQILCKVEAQGAIEEPDIIKHLMMLEGGPEAFKKRSKKYGKTL